jgi:hypothetical protein
VDLIKEKGKVQINKTKFKEKMIPTLLKLFHEIEKERTHNYEALYTHPQTRQGHNQKRE